MRSDRLSRALGRAVALLLFSVLALAGCRDSTGSDFETEHVVVVLNSVENSLTVVPLGSADIRTIGLGADGTPTTLAVRDSLAVVPMGITNVVAVVNLRTATVQNLPLPAGSGATGVVIVNDTLAVVANPERNTVSPVNLRSRTVGAEVPVGRYPQSLAATGDRVYVINANLVSFSPAGPGSVTVLNASNLAPVGTVALSGINPGAGEVRGGQLLVLNSGTWNGNNSSLSLVSLATLQETRRVDGFGNFPGSLATEEGRSAYVAAYGTGVLVYNPDNHAMVRGTSNPMVPAGMLPVSAVAFDDRGLLYTLHPGNCNAPGQLVQMSGTGTVIAQVAVGVCPFDLDFGVIRTPVP